MKKILIVEDEEEACFLIEEAIKRSGIKVQTSVARNGEEALRYMDDAVGGPSKSRPIPDIILLDRNMPIVNGFEFLEAYDSKYDHTLPCGIFLCIHSHTDMHLFEPWRHLLMGYIEKPITKDKIRKVVDEYLKLA